MKATDNELGMISKRERHQTPAEPSVATLLATGRVASTVTLRFVKNRDDLSTRLRHLSKNRLRVYQIFGIPVEQSGAGGPK